MPKNHDNTDDKSMLSKIKDKVTSVSGIITGLCAITVFLWTIFREVQSYNIVKESDKNQAIQIDSLNNRVKTLEGELLKVKSVNNLDAFDLGVVYEVVIGNMPDYYYDGVRYKTSNDGKKIYYYVKGILYRTTWDNLSRKYYYTSEDGKVYWCN
jgi:hypothetical protein